MTEALVSLAVITVVALGVFLGADMIVSSLVFASALVCIVIPIVERIVEPARKIREDDRRRGGPSHLA